MDHAPDVDPQETREWLEALEGVIARVGPDRAHFLIERLIEQARRSGAYLPFSANTEYVNTIPVEQQPPLPGDFALERQHVAAGQPAAVDAAGVDAQRSRPLHHRRPGVVADAAAGLPCGTVFSAGTR